MTDREKVIKGLSACMPETEEDAQINCEECPYQCGGNYQDNDHVNLPLALVRDIRALLKAQEPRVMTHYEMENAIPGTVIYCEQRDEVRTYLTPMIKYDDGVFENRFLGAEPQAVFLPNVRFWTSRPTDEQREATPWQAPSTSDSAPNG